MMLRDAGRSIQSRSFGSPRMLSKRNFCHLYDHVENNGMSVCSVEYDGGSWETVTQRSQKKTKRSVLPSPPGLQVSNRFEGFSESWDVEGLEVLIFETTIVGVRTTGRLRLSGKGDDRLWRGRVRDAQGHASGRAFG